MPQNNPNNLYDTQTKNNALTSVIAERFRQDKKWGEQNHDAFTWIAILSEEVGEFSKAALDVIFENGRREPVREEAVQVAAVALAIVECIDRQQS